MGLLVQVTYLEIDQKQQPPRPMAADMVMAKAIKVASRSGGSLAPPPAAERVGVNMMSALLTSVDITCALRTA